MDVLKFFKKAEEVRKINHFIIGETLGTGGYSKVKLGVDTQTGKRVALKVMLADDHGKMTESQKKQLMRELSVMRAVKHPNVIELVEFDAEAQYPNRNGTKTPCVLTVLELAPSGELFDFLMYTGKFGEDTTRTYFHQLMSGIEACHSVGIAHRDIKPENLLLDENYSLKIADFGFAKYFLDDSGQEQKMETACGTRGYLAPELLRGEKYTHLCDIFACGIILFIMYAGFPPFQHAIKKDYWWNKLHTKKYDLFWAAHERTMKFDPLFKDLILHLLSSNPKERYDIKDIKKHDWYKGPIRGAKDLKKHVQKRRKTVAKNRIKKLKAKQSENEIPTGQGIVTRGSKRQSALLRDDLDHDRAAKELGSIDEFEAALENYEARDYTFVQAYNEFKTTFHPREVAERIKHQAVAISAQYKILKDQNLIILVVGVGDSEESEDISIAVKQYRTKDMKYMVVFKRLQGSALKYKIVIDQFFESDVLVRIMDFSDLEDDVVED